MTNETRHWVDTIAQAMGMVSVQARCTLGDALALIAARAEIDDVTVDVTAGAVVDRLIRFDPVGRSAVGGNKGTEPKCD